MAACQSPPTHCRRSLLMPKKSTANGKGANAWEPRTEAARIRHRLDITQAAFAQLLGVSLPTVRKWEQGREPKGAAKKLLQIAGKNPQILHELAET